MELHVSATFQKYGNIWFRPVPSLGEADDKCITTDVAHEWGPVRGLLTVPVWVSNILTSQLRKVRMSLSEFCWKPRFKTLKLSQSFFLVMLDRAPRTRKLRPCVFHLAEWAPEAVMILLAASHKFLVRKDVRYFIWFELTKSVSFWKSFRRTSPEIAMLLFCFWPDVHLT